MKIRAVRLREVGCFSAPIEVEGFSGGLDVLSGPNELGKSTLLKALQLLFTTRHSSQTKSIDRLRPYTGGAPLIEADFEASGRTWRLRKQFLSERQAVLTDLASGNVVARGDDAHRRALELIGGTGGEQQLGLLWVAQGMSLQHTVPTEAAREHLSQVIEREIQAAAGGQEARAVRAKVEQQRRVLVTPRTAKPTGDYQKAIAERDAALRDLDAANLAARQAAARIDQMQDLKARYAALTDPAAAAARRENVKRLTAAHDDANAARQRVRLADAEVKACESRKSQAQQAHQVLTRQLAQVDELQAALTAQIEAESSTRASLERLAQELAAARGARDLWRTGLEAELAKLKRREEADRRREAAQRLSQINVVLAEARAAATRMSEIEALLNKEAVTEQIVEAMARETRAIAALEARIAAQLPKVHISYVPGGAGRITVNDRPLADGETLSPPTPLVLQIEGIGTITVDPALSEDAEHDRADLEAHRAELAAMMSAAGVGNHEAARQRLDERRALEREYQQTSDSIAARAPMGLDALASEARRLEGLADGSDADDVPDRQDIEREVARLTQELRSVEQEAERLAEQHAKVAEALAGVAAGRQSCEKQLSALASVLPSADERSKHLDMRVTELSAASEAVAAAIRTREAWAEKALDESQMRTLEAALAEAVRAERAAEEDVRRLERDIAVLARDLERDWQDGVETRVVELEQRCASLRERVAHFERDLAALDLLLNVLDRVEARSRAQYLSPVMKRFESYAGLIFPDAAISMSGDLGIETLKRASVPEHLSALSDGTQEQIAVLARLAFGQLLADAGRPSPLILDDALVYSDDTRLEALFTALQAASAAHQVIILTCRARTFERLGGTQLVLRPWQIG